MITIHLLHGIHTSKKSRRLAALVPIVERASGMRTVYHEYGDIWGIQTRRQNPIIAERLAPLIGPDDWLVGHSNANPIWLRSVRDFGARPQGMVILNGALNDSVEFPASLREIHVYFNRYDEAVPWAALSPHWMTDPLWGDMGRDGYRGSDPRVTHNIDCWGQRTLPPLSGHSSIIDAEAGPIWAQVWARRISAASQSR